MVVDEKCWISGKRTRLRTSADASEETLNQRVLGSSPRGGTSATRCRPVLGSAGRLHFKGLRHVIPIRSDNAKIARRCRFRPDSPTPHRLNDECLYGNDTAR